MKKIILETCVDSVESAIAAKAGGADRLELCSSLITGGVTPSAGLFQQIKKRTGLPVHVLIRPRFGDFCYTIEEMETMKEDIRIFRELGADGVVIGVLREDGSLDSQRMGELMERAKGIHVTLHRAFDMSRDPFETMEAAISMGINTILTSGQADSSLLGAECIRELTKKSRERIQIMAGGGITEENISLLYQKTGAHAWHLSGKKKIKSRMRFRNTAVHMGLNGFDEYELYRTDEQVVKRIRELLLSLQE